MGNDNQFVEQPVPGFVNPTTATTTTSSVIPKDGIVSIQTPIEHIESRRNLLNEEQISQKNHRFSSSSRITADKIFAIALLILLIILIAYILFHGKITDMKLTRLSSTDDLKSNDIRTLLEDINRTLESIQTLLIEQGKKPNVNVQLTGQDVRELSSNETVLNEFLRRLKQCL